MERLIQGPIEWRKQAECRGSRVNFHPDMDDKDGVYKAKAICASCPVKDPCLEFALANNQPGIWGNTTERERKRIKRRRSR